MYTKNKLLASVLCLILVALCVVGMSACNSGDGECAHKWGEWSETASATCTQAGTRERKCSECGETETSAIDALGHDWNEATCSTPKTCKTCSATEGAAADHAFTVETVKAEALKSAATCADAAVYYKSCACGKISTSDDDVFTDGDALGHKDEDFNHVCDRTCGKTDVGEHADANKDHACDYGCSEPIALCEDKDKNHECDYGCGKAYGEHADGDDEDHLCDYDCGEIADDGCYDTVVDGKCDECGEDIDHTCADADKNHACDICSANIGEHTDKDKNHICEYGCSETFGTCEDKDKDHECDYGCAKTFGTCEDKVKDHECDYGCGKVYGEHADGEDNNHLCDYGCDKIADEGCRDTLVDGKCDECGADIEHPCVDENKNHACDICSAEMGKHADSADDNDHKCDYGCGATLEDCHDADGDGNHKCDVCGGEDVTGHDYKAPTCTAPATCSECGLTDGMPLEHKDNDFDHNCDYGCGKNDMGEHADSADDNDHKCDYGCDTILEDCRDADDDNDHACDVCGKADVSTHSFELVSTTPATCTSAAVNHYECNCGDKDENEDGDALGHNVSGVTPIEEWVSGCEYVLVYTCQREGCEAPTVYGETIYKHSHVASIERFATCKDDGLKTFKCACGDEKEPEIIPADATGHKWVNGEVVDGIRIDTCSECGETKTVTVYAGTKTDEINAGDLADKEIELNNANISLDSGVIDAIGDQKVTVSADKLEGDDRKETLGLSVDQLGQVGDNPIYNFTINNGTENISDFNGNWVTITLPYELSEGEDVDSIAIWFISDKCADETCTAGDDCTDVAHRLVSMFATYNDGYVTFKTNHFSYYTVTRLTPEQRCELYGHGFVAQHVEGSCTKDSYDLYVCVRCHEKYIDEDSRVIADGHDYVAVEVPATCTARGSITYTCEDCGYHYTTRLNATGHAWKISESVDANCSADGYVKYSCDNCGDEYVITYAKLNHDYTHSTVEATCEVGGYTVHVCEKCNFSYTDTYTSALGHTYLATDWKWAGDYSTASLTFVCQRDASHTTAVSATVEVFVKQGICSNFVQTTYTATVVYNGIEYTDEKVVEEGSSQHTYSSEWTYDGDNHWHECICGDKADVAPHAYGNQTVVKQPTCTENGEAIAYCVCGNAEIKTLPATGEHTYENGACTGCGKVENNCDHTELHRNSVNAADFGCCEWYLYFLTCDCGEVKIIDTENSKVACDFEYIDEDEYEDENGNRGAYMKGMCSECGLIIEATMSQTADGCHVSISQVYSFYIGDAYLIRDAHYDYERDYHGRILRQTLELSQYGACGGVMIAYVCEDCGKITEIDRLEEVCDFDLEGTPIEETYVDEKGVTHTVYTYSCSVCGLTLSNDRWSEVLSACQTKDNYTAQMICGDNVIVNVSDYEIDGDHKYDSKYELEGDYCTDGLKIIATCATCGDSYTYATTNHYNTRYVTIDLSEYTECGGTVRVEQCTVCGCGTYMQNMNLKCTRTPSVEESILDADGNVIGRIYTSECTVCGLVFVDKAWYEAESECVYTMYQHLYICKDDEILLACIDSEYEEDHDYEYTYETNGGSCDQTYHVIETCKKCGHTDDWYRTGHTDTYFDMDLADFGLCGGRASGYRCEVCGQITNCHHVQIGCNNVTTVETTHIDENGNEHRISIQTCNDCGAEFVSDYWTERVSECVTRGHGNMTIYFGNEILLDYDEHYEGNNHNYKYEYSLKGETCEDGYYVTRYCTVCGTVENWGSGSGHNTRYFEMNMGEYGCGGYICGERCEICGLVTYIDSMKIDCDTSNATFDEVVDDDGNVCQVMSATCTNCGLNFVSLQWTVEESVCVTVLHQQMQIYKDGQIIFNYLGEEREEQHDSKVTIDRYGESCSDGYMVTTTCDRCGLKESYTSYGCNSTSREISFEEFGMCGGYIREDYCTICGIVAWSYVNSGCYWNRIGVNDEGYEVYQCYHCKAYRYYTEQSEKDEDCRISTSYTYIYVTASGEEAYRYTNTSFRYEHRYEYDFTMYGDSCTDGYDVYAVCLDCGDEWSDSKVTYHNTYEKYSSDNNSEFCEDHNVSVSVCPCGDYYDYSINSQTFTYDKRQNTYTCDTCGLIVKTIDSTEENGCASIRANSIVVIFADEEIYRFDREVEYANHSFHKFESVIDGGTTYIYSACNECGAEVSTEIMQAELEEYYQYDNAVYYYDFTVTPNESGNYAILGLDDIDSHVTLYESRDGNLAELDSNDDGGWNNQFYLSYRLEAGRTYVYRISYLGGDRDGTIPFSFGMTLDQANCNHNEYTRFAVLFDGSESCTDGVLCGEACVDCGRLFYAGIEYEHYIYNYETVDFKEFGACYGEASYGTCACGQEADFGLNDYCGGNWTNEEYYDDLGRFIRVETCTCYECGFRYTLSYYTERDRENCEIVYYNSLVINVRDTLVKSLKYQRREESHDIVATGSLMNGEGSSCEDGVIISYKCRDCDYGYDRHTYYHEQYEMETFDLGDYGSVCGGYATVYGCTCGRYQNVKLDHALCEFDTEHCEIWIDGVLTEGQHNMSDWYYIGYDAYVYTCAVTDPADKACAYKIRQARYWLADEDSCYAYQYETWQFGYNERTGTFEREITFKTGSMMLYHDYIYSGTGDNYCYECKDCGSYYKVQHYYDNNGREIKYERTILNTLDNEYNKYQYNLREYAYRADGGYYTSRVYDEYIYSDGSEYWCDTTRTEEAYVGTFGTDGRRISEKTVKSDGYVTNSEYACVYYQGYEYTIYSYGQDGDYWYRYDYSYTFNGECIMTESYSNSDGEEWTEQRNYCRYYKTITKVYPTCSQDGLAYKECVVCGHCTEPYATSSKHHSWTYVSDNWYYCMTCGLENANGADGTIIMEDLTEKYGNGEYYVVGYDNRSLVEFTYYVSLVLPNGEDILIPDGIDFVQLDDVRAFAFSKAQVDAWAAANGYTDYDVKFAFVPVGSDSSFDYAITFAEGLGIDTIINKVSFKDYFAAGDKKYYTITPTESCYWTFVSFADSSRDVYIQVRDKDGNYIASNDNGGYYNNFWMDTYLEAGVTYVVEVGMYDYSGDGEIPMLFYPETYYK